MQNLILAKKTGSPDLSGRLVVKFWEYLVLLYFLHDELYLRL